MNRNLKIFGGFFGMTAVILGAFGAHALAEQLSPESLKSFETGVKYQMYHALLMIILGFNAKATTSLYKFIFYLLVFGVIFFSGSIYFLSTNTISSFDFSVIALVTPLGGTLLIISWILILISFWSKN
jgi:uncharacterized membrane protein YgdD (TMEM256/DUF423 family)